MQFPSYSALRGLKAGAIGGIIGALALGILAGLSAFVLDQEVFYVTIARKLGLASPLLTGWALHFLVGLIAGGIFIATTALFKRFALVDKEELLGRPTWWNSRLDTRLRTDYRSSRSRRPIEPDVRRGQLHLPSGLRGCDSSRLPLSDTQERKDENPGPRSLGRGLGRFESDHLERVHFVSFSVEKCCGIPFVVPDESVPSPV